MNKIFLIAFASLLLIGAGCGSSVTITTDYDKEMDFSTIKTFGFLKWNEESAELVNDINRRRLENAVASQLELRGMKRVEGMGDSMIGFHVIVETKTGTTSYTDHYGGMGYYGRGRGFGYGYGSPYGSTTTTSEYSYQVGTVIIDQYQSATKNLIWEGVAQGEIDANHEAKEENIKKDIKKMFSNYPVPLLAPM